MARLGLRLTPHGRLSVEDQDDGPGIDTAVSIRLIDAFAQGTGYGLMWLGAAEVGQALPPLFNWWRDFAALYVGSLCLHASGLEAEERVKPPSIPAPTAAAMPVTTRTWLDPPAATTPSAIPNMLTSPSCPPRAGGSAAGRARHSGNAG